MPTLSLKKIFTAIIGTIILFRLKDLLEVLEPIYFWFCESLDGLRDFEDGAQVAIAITSIILIVVLILRAFDKY